MDERTLKIFEFICEHMAQHGYAPSYRAIGAACYVSHTTVLRHLDRLEGLGWIERVPHIPRSMVIGPNAPKKFK